MEVVVDGDEVEVRVEVRRVHPGRRVDGLLAHAAGRRGGGGVHHG